MTKLSAVVEGKEGPVKKFRTYEGWDADPQAVDRAYADSVFEEAREERRVRRARTHNTIASVPSVAMPIAAAVISLLATLMITKIWGPSSAVTMQLGASMAALYFAANDIRMSVVLKDPDWRVRHRVFSWLARRHPLD